jgi:hypothetical protein
LLTFLHLSDIHFHRGISETLFDIDAELRNELELDLARCCDKPATGVLVTGDIAFGAKPAEYDTARAWLRKLTNLLGCSEVDVWTVPGNHDIDRAIIEESPATQRLHEDLRSLRGNDLNKRLRTALGDPIESEALFKPLEAYNKFAFGFDCQIGPAKLYWEDELELDDGSILRLRGLTSPLSSDRHDNVDGFRLFLSDYQTTTLHREDGVEYLTLCHHPFDWLTDQDRARDRLDRARIRLFGHKHRQRIREENNGIFLVAGATHPSRDTEWEPRYNVIRVGIETGEDGGRIMSVGIKARVWDDADGVFKADVDRDGRETREYSWPLTDRAQGEAASTRAEKRVRELKDTSADQAPPTGSPLKQVERPERMLVYRLVSLPRQRQQQIAVRLGLIAEDDWFRGEAELWRALLTRAKESRKLAELWSTVDSALADGRFDGYQNPFERTRTTGRETKV